VQVGGFGDGLAEVLGHEDGDVGGGAGMGRAEGAVGAEQVGEGAEHLLVSEQLLVAELRRVGVGLEEVGVGDVPGVLEHAFLPGTKAGGSPRP
jgi:hypothetical protein